MHSKVLNKKGPDVDGSDAASALAPITSYALAQWSDLVDAEEKTD
jgi:hypothetical protein